MRTGLTLGIDVTITKLVSYNPLHEERVKTWPANNPSYVDLGALRVAAVFKRHRSPRDEQDGNPLIYSLKKLRGYTIAPSCVTLIAGCACSILPNCFKGQKFDFIVPMPSSARIPARLAQCAASAFGHPAQVLNLFRKATAAEALAAMPAIATVAPRDKEDFKRTQERLASVKPGSAFSMKDVPARIRCHMIPICLSATSGSLAGKSILLVDDLLSSGQTLKVGSDILNRLGATATKALVFLGPIGNRPA